ncbi:putative multi-domain containing protein [Aduncisulcus paluster]|uniref:Multi-domain containing protein n=1 Tax=Aduncisulcus paluster TaxID=2918883 RepID=A0ABQ5KPG7_9EUKA|nr:putative multi-domain containing protein [Aduncisulcus paluster]|eukprot:gnl/Carplike_NY0171/6114_a8389_369.p1 GENE.gnl/Carplike_NY0171/6114_a8389_369~~gnl/Carplike_NY0171/6114_a8389_369.p1  ORF type:complete len:185 (-),score=20.53 gnl/Carplike_NY0171/6114_a8389_369:60-614(-)
MGLLTVLRDVKEKEKEMRILILGLDNAGKTTTIKRIKGEDVDKISPTVGFTITSFDFLSFKLNIWDVGGQRTIRSYWRNYYEKTDGIIWVVDCSDRRRIESCQKEFFELLAAEKLEGASLLVLANKQDIAGAMTPKEVVKHLKLDDVKRRHWRVQKASAMTGFGLKEGFDWLVDDISKRIFIYD